MAVEEVDLCAPYVGETGSALVDVVVAAGAAEQLGPRCLAGDFERGRDWRDAVCLGNDEQEGDTHGGGASYGPTPGEAEQRPRGDAVVPWRPVLRGHELLPERAVRRDADGQVPGPTVTSEVERLAAEEGTEAVEQCQSEDADPVFGL